MHLTPVSGVQIPECHAKLLFSGLGTKGKGCLIYWNITQYSYAAEKEINMTGTFYRTWMMNTGPCHEKAITAHMLHTMKILDH